MLGLPSRAFALALAAVSCTPDKSSESTDGSTDGSTSAATDGPSTDPTSGSSGAPSCQDALPADVVGDPVTIKIRNSRAEPVYLDQASNCNADYADPFGMKSDLGPFPFAQGDCLDSCDLIPTDACGCNEFCIDQPVLLLQPGATYTATWSSNVLTSVPVPESCPMGQLCTSTCSVFQLADAGTYTVHTLASAEIVCTPGEGGQCSCTPNADGWCWMQWDSYEAVNPVEVSAQLTIPADTAVELVIQ